MFHALGHRFELRESSPTSSPLYVKDDHGHDQLCYGISLAFAVCPVLLASNLCEKLEFNAIEDLGICYRDNDAEMKNEVGVYSHQGDVDVSLRDFREYVLAYVRAAIPFRFEDASWFYERLPDPVLALIKGETQLPSPLEHP